jgi:methylated-DNA-[protein]-cysteine S-methyltransferase
MMLVHKKIPSVVGELTLVAEADALVAVLWERERIGRVRLPQSIPAEKHRVLEETQRQLEEYFAGRRVVFELPLRMRGTEFQMRVWEGLRAIPPGELWSYSQLAQAIGCAGSARAVGAAVGRNPISIIVPCHRVVGWDGGLTGFAGGLEAKRVLIGIERHARQPV